ncbi:MAG: hypothetical protein U0271_10410 [Polyangiaceae bacterium]
MRGVSLAFALALGACSSAGPDVVFVELAPSAAATSSAWTALSASPSAPFTTRSLAGVRPGMSRAELTKLLGEPSDTMDFESTRKLWTNAGYEPDEELPFILGFDDMLTFDCKQRGDWVTAWYVYVKRGRTVLAKGSVCNDPPGVTTFGFAPSCFVGMNITTMEAALGLPSQKRTDHLGRLFHFYLERGIAVMSQDNRVDVLDVYEPLDRQRAREVASRLMRREQTRRP